MTDEQTTSSQPALTRGMDSCLHLYEGDIIAGPPAITDGALPVPTGPGLGVSLDYAAVAARTIDRCVIED